MAAKLTGASQDVVKQLLASAKNYHEPITSRKELLQQYSRGNRNFQYAQLDGVDLAGRSLTGASFYGACLRGVNLEACSLIHTQFKSADLTDASLAGSFIAASDLIGADFTRCNLSKVDLTGACLSDSDLTGANLTSAYFGNTSLSKITLHQAKLSRAIFSGTDLSDLDVRPLCDVRSLKHSSPSTIDYRTVVKSYLHPGIKRFLLDCGVAEIFAEYMIDCARAIDAPALRTLMQSTFISYGAPDEVFARRLYNALRAYNIIVFFFPESATLGERIDNEVFRCIQEHDRILLICSRNSLCRPGVINEIQETLDREARDGGASYLLPIMIDDYVLSDWKTVEPVLAERIGRRIIGDFRKAKRTKAAFDLAVSKVIDVLKARRP